MRISAVALVGLSLGLAACTTTRSGPNDTAMRETMSGTGSGASVHAGGGDGAGGDPAPAGADRIVTGSIGPGAGGLGSGAARPVDLGVRSWYAERHARFPDGAVLTYCHGFGCELQTAITLTEADDAALKALFAAEAKTAEGERIAIDHAVSWWEKRAAPLLGGPPDRRGSELKDAHVPGQTDCLDEATNSTTILVYLERKGLLAFHHVERPESRGAFLYAHATAVVRDMAADRPWVVDSWMRDSGDPNDVMPLDEWISKAYS